MFGICYFGLRVLGILFRVSYKVMVRVKARVTILVFLRFLGLGLRI